MRVVATFALSGSNEFTCSRAEQTLSTTSSLPTHSFFGSVDGPPFVYLEPITKQPFSADRFWSLVLIQWSVFQSTARTILSSVNHYLSGNQISPLSTHQRQSSISIPHAGRVAPRIPLPALNPSSNVRRPQRLDPDALWNDRPEFETPVTSNAFLRDWQFSYLNFRRLSDMPTTNVRVSGDPISGQVTR
jgi:hypothetical protein